MERRFCATGLKTRPPSPGLPQDLKCSTLADPETVGARPSAPSGVRQRQQPAGPETAGRGWASDPCPDCLPGASRTSWLRSGLLLLRYRQAAFCGMLFVPVSPCISLPCRVRLRQVFIGMALELRGRVAGEIVTQLTAARPAGPARCVYARCQAHVAGTV